MGTKALSWRGHPLGYTRHMTISEVGIVPEIELRHRLRIARERTTLDAQSFAEELGMSRNAVNKAERGVTTPRELTLRAWAMRTGVSLHWLKTGETPPRDGDGASKLPELDSNQQPAGIKHPVTSITAALAA